MPVLEGGSSEADTGTADSGSLPTDGGAVKINLLFLSILLPACKVSEDKFIEEAAQSICSKWFECAEEEDLEMMWDDEGECREFIEGENQPEGDEADCEYDAKAADDCLDAYDEMDCDDVMEGTTPRNATTSTRATARADRPDADSGQVGPPPL